MKILATGSTGTIGRFMGPKVGALNLDLRAFELLDRSRIFNKNDTLIHLAAVVGEDRIQQDVENAHKVNVRGTLALAKLFFEQSKQKMIFASTAHVYETTSDPIDEDGPTKPWSEYGRQKLEAEEGLRKLFSKEPNRLLIVRIFSILDWGLNSESLSGAISNLQKNGTVKSLSNGDDIRDFLTPRTVAGALVELAEIQTQYQTINVCSGTGISVRRAASILLQHRGVQVTGDMVNSGTSKNPIIIGNSERLELTLGRKLQWTPCNFE